MKAVQEKLLPDVDDELAVAVSEFETLDELKADLQRRLQESVDGQAEELYRRMVIDAVTERSSPR